MRLTRLDLLRYGHLADVTLHFPPAARLHVVLGPNEAGKSTALSAIGDALFGFGHRTDYAFLYDGPQLRLGFEVEAADGTREAFLRLKRLKDPLRDAAEQPVPEAALARMLGHATRSLFETTYGLNAETLRQGSLSLLESGGRAGESLLAGMGLPHLRGALTRLDEQAKSLAGSRKHNQELGTAIKAYRQAQKEAEEAAIRPREWAEAEAELDAVLESLAAAQAEAAALRAEESRLRRARLVRPILAGLDHLRAELAALPALPPLPADAAARLARAREALREAEAEKRREEAEATALEAERDALPRDAAVLAVQDRIDALAARRAAVEGDAAKLPAAESRAASHRAEVAAAASQLGTAATPEALRDGIPPAAARKAAQRLLTRRAELEAALSTATEMLETAERARDAAARRLEEMPEPLPATALRRAIHAARAEGPLERELEAAGRRRAEAARSAATALAALPLFGGDAAALAAIKLPLEPEAEALAVRLAAAAQAAQAARERVAQLEAEARELEAEMLRLARGGTVPTPEAIAAARAAREQAWRGLRRALEAGQPAAPPDLDGFEALRDQADRLADLRAEDAGRVTQYAEKAARLGWLREGGMPAAAAAQEAADRECAEAGAAWVALWAPAGILPRSPAAMAAWRRERAEVLRLTGQEAEAAARCDELAARLAAARAALLSALPDGQAPGLAALLEEAEAACTAREAAEAERAGLLRRRDEAAERAAEAATRHASAEAALASLHPDWDTAAQALGLPPGAPAEAMESALEAWTRIAGKAEAWAGEARHCAEIRSAVADFAAATGVVLAALEEAGTDPAPLAVARLERRLAAARAAERDAQTLSRRARERREKAAAAARAQAEAARELDALRAQAGAADLPALEAVIRDATRHAELTQAIAAQAAELIRQGDGLEEARLREEAAASDPDAALARLREIEAGEAARAEALRALGARQQAAETRLATMRAGRDAALHAQAARHHLAAAQGAAERYARLHLARSLLQAGIERLRQDRQAPLLRAASAHFARLTGGRYPLLEADEAEGGNVVLRALRPDRTACPVGSLSEGTRDQLYLALRVAAVEAHAEGAEPLPFIADDLLVTFDDTRAAAALALLARLGERVQTILFTHHAHVADLAARIPGAHVLELGGAAAPRAALPAALAAT